MTTVYFILVAIASIPTWPLLQQTYTVILLIVRGARGWVRMSIIIIIYY